jgi:hypothetical protein
MQRSSVSVEVQPAACRLCGGGSSHSFSKTVLGKYDVRYQRCERCNSLQTEPPYWLAEAYASGALNLLDTGAAQRNVGNFSVCLVLCKLLGARNVLDYGGGDGLLCRLLRDYGLNCYVSDRYASPSYALGFTKPDFERPEMVLLFEVLEHFANPRDELGRVFELGADSIVATTDFYDGHDQNWWFLIPETGQHVFFYSRRGLEEFARGYGYSTLFVNQYAVFRRGSATQMSRVRDALLKLSLAPRVSRLIRGLTALMRPNGHITDFNRLSTGAASLTQVRKRRT